MELKDNLRKLRTEKNLNQTEIAKIFNLTISGYSKWEQGRTVPSSTQIMEICKFYEITPNELLGVNTQIQTRNTSEIIELADNEKELLNIFRQLAALQQLRILGYAKAVLEG